MTNNNDAPAFPQRVPTGVCKIMDDGQMEREFETVGGLSKREWFAGMALQGLMANSSVGCTTEGFVRSALLMADALLAELNNGEK